MRNCSLCELFIQRKTLCLYIKHLREKHAGTAPFSVTCLIEGCRLAPFKSFEAFYKHCLRQHRDESLGIRLNTTQSVTQTAMDDSSSNAEVMVDEATEGTSEVTAVNETVEAQGSNPEVNEEVACSSHAEPHEVTSTLPLALYKLRTLHNTPQVSYLQLSFSPLLSYKVYNLITNELENPD